MSDYRKQIQITFTGMVVAKVFFKKDRPVGLQFYNSIFDSKKRRFLKAHKWADQHIKLCEDYETLTR
jgi:hypothetical protein